MTFGHPVDEVLGDATDPPQQLQLGQRLHHHEEGGEEDERRPLDAGDDRLHLVVVSEHQQQDRAEDGDPAEAEIEVGQGLHEEEADHQRHYDARLDQQGLVADEVLEVPKNVIIK